MMLCDCEGNFGLVAGIAAGFIHVTISSTYGMTSWKPSPYALMKNADWD